MATFAHKNLTGVDLHEPKGIEGAVANRVYVSNGSGSGTWSQLGIAGLATDSRPGLVPLSTSTVSGQSNIEFKNLSSSYDTFRLKVHGLRPSVSGASFLVQVSTNNGSSYQSSGYQGLNTSTFGSSSSVQAPSASSAGDGVALSYDTVADASFGVSNSAYLSGEVELMTRTGSTPVIFVKGIYASAGGFYIQFSGAGLASGTTKIDAFRIIPTSGNLSGTFSLYGYVNA